MACDLPRFVIIFAVIYVVAIVFALYAVYGLEVMMAKKATVVQVYFENPNQEKVYKKILKLQKKTGMSISRIGYLAMLYGLPKAAEAVTGVYLDAEVAHEAESKETPEYNT